ncbi:MAG: 30S ribosome-binding factor RbfA [Phycisphaerales bacterium JB063]
MTHRVEQVESTMRKALAQVLQRKISDPRIRGLVSITQVDVSPDMKAAKVLISVMPQQYEKRTLAGLRAANRHIHGELKKLVAFRIVPHLDFRLDTSLKDSDEVFDAINQAMARTGDEDTAPDPEDSPTPSAGPDLADADPESSSS